MTNMREPLRKTKIICTLGPSTKTYETIKAISISGCDAYRINFSHGDRVSWDSLLKIVKKIEEEEKKYFAIIGDLQGPNIRLGVLKYERIRVKKNQEIKIINALTTESKNTFPLPEKEFFKVVENGDILTLGDGQVRLKVIEKQEHDIKAKVTLPGEIRSRMSIRIEGKQVKLPFVTTKDKEDLEFATKNNFSHIMASFVEQPEHIKTLREELNAIGGEELLIYAKIETKMGVRNLKKIVRVVDGIVIARGDLGSHYPLEKLPALQKEIMQISREYGKPVVIATQLLSSMVSSPIPTRSEIVDIYNAVLEGSDALMLTNETAIGSYPVEAVRWLEKTIREAEKKINYDSLSFPENTNTPLRFSRGVIELSESLNAYITVYSMKGNAVRLLSIFKPRRGLYVGTNSVRVYRISRLYWGAVPLFIDAREYEEGLEKTLDFLRKYGVLKAKDIVVATYRMMRGEKHYIKIIEIE